MGSFPMVGDCRRAELRSRLRSRGEVSFEIVLLCAAVALACVFGLQHLGGHSVEAFGQLACRLVSQLGLSGDCATAEAFRTAAADRRQADLSAPDLALDLSPALRVEGRGLGEPVRGETIHETRFVGLSRDEIRAALVADGFSMAQAALRSGAIYRALHPVPGEVLLASAAEDWLQQAGGTRPRLVWENPNPRPGPGRPGPGRALALRLGLAGLFVEGMLIAKRLVNGAIPPQLIVPMDDRNAVVLDWQTGGVAVLGLVSNGEASELLGLVRLEHAENGAVLAATSRDGTIFARKGLTEEEWTLQLGALPDALARRIREQPAIVRDPTLYPRLALTPALRPGEQLVEFNGIVYLRNHLTGTLRPLFTVGADNVTDANATTMTAGGGNGAGDPGAGGRDGEDEEGSQPPVVTLSSPSPAPALAEAIALLRSLSSEDDARSEGSFAKPSKTEQNESFQEVLIDTEAGRIVVRLPTSSPPVDQSDPFIQELLTAAERGDDEALERAMLRLRGPPTLDSTQGGKSMYGELLRHIHRLPRIAELRAAHFQAALAQFAELTKPWSARLEPGQDGSHVFVGREREVLVISPAGRLYRGEVNYRDPSNIDYTTMTPLLTPGTTDAMIDEALYYLAELPPESSRRLQRLSKLAAQMTPGERPNIVGASNGGLLWVADNGRAIVIAPDEGVYDGIVGEGGIRYEDGRYHVDDFSALTRTGN